MREKITTSTIVIIIISTLLGFLLGIFLSRKIYEEMMYDSKTIQTVLQAEKEGRIEITTVTIENLSTGKNVVDTVCYKIKEK